MISKAVLEALQKFVPCENIRLQEPMADHTTFRIGGPADCFVQLENEKQLKDVRRYLELAGVPFFVIGNGSNLLVSDSGYQGVVLQIGSEMSDIRVEGCRMVAKAGASLAQTARMVMNAGAYGGEMCQVVTQVTVVNRDGETMELDNETMEFGYRTSVIRHSAFIVTEVAFSLAHGDRDTIQARMEELAGRRREKQPLEYPSAGSTFKRPEGHFAGQLIMEAGFRGFQKGGARVSDKHCGFIINTGNGLFGSLR